MMFRRLLSTSTAAKKKVLSFPGQGQPVGKTFVQELHREYDLTSFFQKLESQISPGFAKNVQAPADDFYSLTSNTQPSIVSLSLLIIDILKTHHGIDLVKDSDYTLGHSLGEYTSLCINDVFQVNQDKIVWLVRQRGVLMEEALANSKEEYGMTALVFPAMNYDDVETLLLEALSQVETVAIANINSPQQIVISGAKSELAQIVQFIKDRSTLKRRLKTIPLSVTTPFHNPLLQSSRSRFHDIVRDKFTIDRDARLKLPIFSNLSGDIVHTHGEALDNFINDFTSPVQFKKTIENAVGLGLDEVWNIGPNGHINQGNISKIVDDEVKNISIGTVDEIKKFVEDYKK